MRRSNITKVFKAFWTQANGEIPGSTNPVATGGLRPPSRHVVPTCKAAASRCRQCCSLSASLLSRSLPSVLGEREPQFKQFPSSPSIPVTYAPLTYCASCQLNLRLPTHYRCPSRNTNYAAYYRQQRRPAYHGSPLTLRSPPPFSTLRSAI